MRSRKILTAALIVLVLALQNLCMVSADTDEYTVTEADRHIKDEAGLRKLAEIVNKYGHEFENEEIYLEADITLGDEPFIPIGTLEHPFKGILVGDDHIITGLKLTDIDGIDCYGLFGVAENASIELVKLSDVDINITKESQNEQNMRCVGGLAGICVNCNIMMGCVDSGTIKAHKDTSKTQKTCLGGVIGVVVNTEVRFCRNNAQIVSNYDTIGGIAGILNVYGTNSFGNSNYGSIEYCCNNADINASGSTSCVGGVAAVNADGVLNICYNTGKITNGNAYTSGIAVVNNSKNSHIYNCVDMCGENAGMTSNAGTLEIKYAGNDYKSVPMGTGSEESVKHIDMDMSELEIVKEVNENCDSYIWAVNYGHPVFWWQSIHRNDAMIRGDVSGDGNLGPKDVALILKHIDGAAAITDDRLPCADYNADNSIDFKDIIMIMNNSSRYFEYVTT